MVLGFIFAMGEQAVHVWAGCPRVPRSTGLAEARRRDFGRRWRMAPGTSIMEYLQLWSVELGTGQLINAQLGHPRSRLSICRRPLHGTVGTGRSSCLSCFSLLPWALAMGWVDLRTAMKNDSDSVLSKDAQMFVPVCSLGRTLRNSCGY